MAHIVGKLGKVISEHLAVLIYSYKIHSFLNLKVYLMYIILINLNCSLIEVDTSKNSVLLFKLINYGY